MCSIDIMDIMYSVQPLTVVTLSLLYNKHLPECFGHFDGPVKFNPID